jgi:hypothetical protein
MVIVTQYRYFFKYPLCFIINHGYMAMSSLTYIQVCIVKYFVQQMDPPKDPPCQDWFNLFSKEKLYDLRQTDNGHYVMAKAHLAKGR